MVDHENMPRANGSDDIDVDAIDQLAEAAPTPARRPFGLRAAVLTGVMVAATVPGLGLMDLLDISLGNTTCCTGVTQTDSLGHVS